MILSNLSKFLNTKLLIFRYKDCSYLKRQLEKNRLSYKREIIKKSNGIYRKINTKYEYEKNGRIKAVNEITNLSKGVN